MFSGENRVERVGLCGLNRGSSWHSELREDTRYLTKVSPPPGISSSVVGSPDGTLPHTYSIVPWSKILCYLGNRVPLGTHALNVPLAGKAIQQQHDTALPCQHSLIYQIKIVFDT